MTAVQIDPDNLSGIIEEKMEDSDDDLSGGNDSSGDAESVWKQKKDFVLFYGNR